MAANKKTKPLMVIDTRPSKPKVPKNVQGLDITHGYSKQRLAYLNSRGVSGANFMYSTRDKFPVPEALVPIQHKVRDYKILNIDPYKQLGVIKSFLAQPFKPWLITVSSYPSDKRAKQLATFLFERACTEFQAQTNNWSKSAPLWHTVYGGLGDSLLDSSVRPSLLVISNVVPEITGYKLEKVRDLLEKHNDIPRILVQGAPEPVSLFRNRLFLPVTGYISVGGSGRSEEHSL